jgi:hypothetical protein
MKGRLCTDLVDKRYASIYIHWEVKKVIMMKKIKREDFDCIKEDNSEEEDKKQWERSKIIFDRFFEYLKDKGLKESTASKRTQRIVFFILDYLFVYDDALSILEVSGDTIRTFLGNWYIRKVLNS